MKNSKIYLLIVMISMGCCFASCGSAESSNEKSGDSIKTQDSSLLNNYNNSYPNDRIHIQDSNAAVDSSKINDSINK